MELVTVFYIVLLLSASALCIALIVYLNRITKSVQQLQKDINEFAEESKPLIESTHALSEKLNHLSELVKEQATVTKSIVEDFRERADKILELEEKVRRGIEQPVDSIIKNLSAIVKGFNTFWDAYKGK